MVSFSYPLFGVWPSKHHCFLAAKTFGKFQDSFLSELYAEILSHSKQEATGRGPQPVQGITVVDSEILEPEPVRPGGLQVPGPVSYNEAAKYIIRLTLH